MRYRRQRREPAAEALDNYRRHDHGDGTAPKLRVAALLGIGAAAGLVPLNSTMIAVTLPRIADDFDISTGTASILVTMYLVAMLVGQPLAGRLGDAIGNRRIVTIALIGLIATSAVAAASTTFTMLMISRLALAVFAAALGPGVQSLLRAVTAPEHQGRTFGLLGSILGVGAASGPVIGGALTQLFDWRATFLINIPIAGGALFVALRSAPPAATQVGRTNVNSSTHNRDDVTEGVHYVEPADIGHHHEGRIANSVFVAAFSVQALSTLAQYALLLLTPIMLDARGWGSGSVGLVLSALTVGMILVGPPGGRLGDHRGHRLPTLAGLVVASAAVVTLLIAGRLISVPLLVVSLAFFGLGLGTAIPNVMTAALGSVPARRTGSAAGVLAMSRYVGSITTSVAISIFVTSNADGARSILGLSLASVILAMLAAARLPHSRKLGTDSHHAM